MIISYVVLHYLTAADTIECVDSLLNNVIPNSEDENHIIIVDNGSPNDSYRALEEEFGSSSDVILIKNKENLGFAKGNNTGFLYAKYELGSDFILLLNNDTYIEQNNFADVLTEKYQETNYAVLGPDIVTGEGYHQNPAIVKEKWSFTELAVFRIKAHIKMFLTSLRVPFINRFLNQRDAKYQTKEVIRGDICDIRLHGACLIFSPQYISRFDGLYDKTFLYMEEDILKFIVDHYGLKTLYSSDLQVFHNRHASTKAEITDDTKRLIFYYKQQIRSSRQFERLKWSYLKEDLQKRQK